MRILAAILLLIPTPSLALSCLPWSVESGYHKASDSADPYVIVEGRFKFDDRLLPKVDWNRQHDTAPLTKISARFEGRQLVAWGKKGPAYQTEVTLEIACAGPWCPHFSSGVRQLAFVHLSDDGPRLEITPCAPMAFEQNERELSKRAQQCLRGWSCELPEPR